jgi:transketolase
MRTAFIQSLLRIAELRKDVWLLNGDLGYSVLEPFAERFPNRFLNAGVAEQNMTGMAAGIAMTGNTVFTYSIANFPTLRCYEQIRNDVCYHDADVKIVSVGGGLSYGAQGYTHHGVEDLGVMRLLPGMVVIAPGDPIEADLATEAIAAQKGPAYLRLGKAGEPIVHTSRPRFKIGKAIELIAGDDAVVIATGGVLRMARAAVERLQNDGMSVRLLSMHTISPIDVEAIVSAAETGVIVAVEEHGPGGLGTAIAEVLTERRLAPSFTRIGLPPKAMRLAGTQAYLGASVGLSEDAIVFSVATSLNANGFARR